MLVDSPLVDLRAVGLISVGPLPVAMGNHRTSSIQKVYRANLPWTVSRNYIEKVAVRGIAIEMWSSTKTSCPRRFSR